jgi:hypothetical protein
MPAFVGQLADFAKSAYANAAKTLLHRNSL